MIDTNTPAMRLRNMMTPSNAATATGSAIPMTTPNHCSWNGIHRNDALLMQHRSVWAPGSAFQSMKSGTGLSDPCAGWSVLASLSDIASM